MIDRAILLATAGVDLFLIMMSVMRFIFGDVFDRCGNDLSQTGLLVIAIFAGNFYCLARIVWAELFA